MSGAHGSVAMAIDGTEELDGSLPIPQWFGPWPGIVVDTKDPLKLGRIRARVAAVYGEDGGPEFISDTQLPWARPAFPAHDLHVPDVGDQVIVEFYGGWSWNPMWKGQSPGTGDPPDEWISAYTPEPKTRIIRTTNGHIIEMRWVDGEEKIRVVTAGGAEFNMKDADAEGGPLIELFLPGDRRITVDDKQQLIRLKTPTQTIEMLDEGAGTINIDTSGAVSVTAGTDVTIEAAAFVGIGQAGIRQNVILNSALAKYNSHSHPGPGAPPTVLWVPVTDSSIATKVN